MPEPPSRAERAARPVISHHAIVLELGEKRFEGTGEAIMRNERVKRLYLRGRARARRA